MAIIGSAFRFTGPQRHLRCLRMPVPHKNPESMTELKMLMLHDDLRFAAGPLVLFVPRHLLSRSRRPFFLICKSYSD